MSKSALYNCKTDGDGYRITKFTPDLDVESSYLVSESECECPAGHRHSCRHRTMLPKFISKHAISGEFFLDFDRGEWLCAITEPSTLEELGEDPASEARQPNEDTFNLIATEIDERMANLRAPEIDLTSLEPILIRMLDLAQPSTLPRIDKDYTNSIGHGPAYEPSIVCDLEVIPTPPFSTKPFRRI